MKTVTFYPSGRKVEVHAGSRVYDAIQTAGLPVASSCGADGTCGKCGIRVMQGRVSAASSHEERVLEANRVAPSMRLSCMTNVETDLVITTDYW